MRCEICNFNDDEVLIKHHIDGNRRNNDINNLMIICSNCHLKIHKRKFNEKNKEIIINLKSEIFNEKRLKEELFKLKERDYKVNLYLKEKGLI